MFQLGIHLSIYLSVLSMTNTTIPLNIPQKRKECRVIPGSPTPDILVQPYGVTIIAQCEREKKDVELFHKQANKRVAQCSRNERDLLSALISRAPARWFVAESDDGGTIDRSPGPAPQGKPTCQSRRTLIGLGRERNRDRWLIGMASLSILQPVRSRQESSQTDGLVAWAGTRPCEPGSLSIGIPWGKRVGFATLG